MTVIGLVAMMNVVNFSDGVDGLAAGVCAIAAAAFAIIAFDLGHAATPAILAALHPRRRRSGSWSTTSRRPRSSWATAAPTCSGSCSAASPSRAR